LGTKGLTGDDRDDWDDEPEAVARALLQRAATEAEPLLLLKAARLLLSRSVLGADRSAR